MENKIIGIDKYKTLPLLPLQDLVLFPNTSTPIYIHEESRIKSIKKILASNNLLFVSAIKNESSYSEIFTQINGFVDVYDIGTVCSVIRYKHLDDGRLKIILAGHYRGSVVNLISEGESYFVNLKQCCEKSNQTKTIDCNFVIQSVKDKISQIISFGKTVSPHLKTTLSTCKDPGKIADVVASHLSLTVNEAQQIQSLLDPLNRLTRTYLYLSRESKIYQEKKKLSEQSQLKEISKNDLWYQKTNSLSFSRSRKDSDSELQLLLTKINSTQMSKEAQIEVERNFKRLEKLPQETTEANMIRSFIESILSIPWGKYTEDRKSLKEVLEILNNHHYGLHDVKDRIVEYIAVKKMNAKAKGPILCLLGPPGVGKTSLGRAIALSINRKFSKLSLGGVKDEADIRGHRKTYIGSFPGKIVQSLIKSKSNNPLILLDEIDKLGIDQSRCGPESALLEVLDPEQNHNFNDHYLGVPCDLSSVFFIATANNISQIPAALKDRLEILEISGYSEHEKIEIAKKHIINKQIKECGLSSYDINFTKNSITHIIRHYTRESGLRNLERQISKVTRKLTRKISENDQNKIKEKITIDKKSLNKFLGQEYITAQTYEIDQDKIGVAIAMAYNGYGGDILPVETTLLKGQHTLKHTGQLGKIMQESIEISYSLIRSYTKKFGLTSSKLNSHEVRIHVPQGAVPKEGPSAGLAIACSLLSAITAKPIASKICMTGELTLHGFILPVGGIKEKLLAAQRYKIKKIILPKENQKDFNSLNKKFSSYFEAHFVNHFEELVDLIF